MKISIALFLKASVMATFMHDPASQGTCVDRYKNLSPQVVFKTYKVKTENLPKKDLHVVKDVLMLLSKVHGKTFAPVVGTKFRYIPDMESFSRQTKGPVDISSRAAGNYAAYVHELGHVVGNRKNARGQRYYDLYNSEVRSPCHFSYYAGSNRGYGKRNEEFAEAFAAYLLAPDLLLDHGSGCRDAFDFFRSTFFRAADNYCPR